MGHVLDTLDDIDQAIRDARTNQLAATPARAAVLGDIIDGLLDERAQHAARTS